MSPCPQRNLLAACAFLFLGTALAADNQPTGLADYTVNAGDILTIYVWKEDDLKRETIVRPDGRFSYPLVGDIQAEGRTIEEIRIDLRARLSKFIPDPTVTVESLKLEGNRVYVVGKVNRPGEYGMVRTVDVMQAISMASGTTPFANLDDIKVLRRSNGQQIAIPFHYGAVESGKKLDQNILLRAGDTVVVP